MAADTTPNVPPMSRPRPVLDFDYLKYPHYQVWTCPACGSGEADETIVVDRYGITVPFMRCRVCTMGYLGELMTREGYTAFYSGPYRKFVHELHYGRTPDTPERMAAAVRHSQRGYVKPLVGLLLHTCNVEGPIRVLDAGGETGYVAKLVLQLLGVPGHITVVDPAVEPKELPGITRMQGYLEDAIPGGPYDLILCAETLDHLAYPELALRNMRQVLAPGGVFYADVVDERSWANHMVNRIKIDHPCYWNKQSFRTVLERAGWTIELEHYYRWITHRRRALCRNR